MINANLNDILEMNGRSTLTLRVLIFPLAYFISHLFYVYIMFLLYVGFHRIYLSCNFSVAVHKGTVLTVKGVVDSNDFHDEKAS